MSNKNAQIISSKIALGRATANVGTLFINNGNAFANSSAFAERVAGKYHYWSWETLTQDILNMADYLLTSCALESQADTDGVKQGARIAFITSNNYQRLVCEMATMSCGLVCVPIFAGYPADLMAKLLEFSELSMLVSDCPEKLLALPAEVLPKQILLLNNPTSARPSSQNNANAAAATDTLRANGQRVVDCFEQIITRPMSGTRREALQKQFLEVDPETLALIMYTSGTSGFPKGVQLNHKNLMSQQKALQLLWQPEPGMRFLCYLPWHHSFGGLFERFFALHSGGCLAIDDSCGKNVDQLLHNFAEIKPHVYFSVPKIYQEIVARVLASPDSEQAFFHAELRFVFTAAAPLPLSISDIFKQKGVPVIEGWGLTETSPCCTLTSYLGENVSAAEKAQSLQRVAGVVGHPIPGVELRMGAENEIMVRGDNVMSGYFKNPAATTKNFTDDGWFKTGDIGAFTDAGVKIISRKERMFKLDNGEKIYPSQLEDSVNSHCKYIKYAYVFGSGEAHPFIIMFPNVELLSADLTEQNRPSACVQPKSAGALAKCLSKCIKEINDARPAGFERIERALVINRALSLEEHELTPSFKMIPKRVEEHYREYIDKVRQNQYELLPDDAFVVPLTLRVCENSL